MKNHHLIIIFSLCILQVTAQTTKKVNAKIDRVTVFLNQAQIESNFSVNVPAGSSKIIIDDIANTIDPNSIQVSGKGDLILLGVKFRSNHLNTKATAKKDSINKLKADIENLEMLLGVAANEEKMIMANANVKSEKDGILPEELKEMIDFFRTKLTEVGVRKLQILRQIEPLKDKKQRLELQLAQDTNLSLPLGEIELSVSASKATNANFDLTYVAQNAGWNPNYDLRIKDTKSPVNIAYKANVYQNTGIDWSNVKLTLSTTNPNMSGQKPEIYPQYLSFEMPRPVYSRNAKMEEGLTASAPISDEGWAGANKTSANITDMVQTALAVNFMINMPYTIPTGGNPEVVEIQNYKSEARYSNMAAPKFDNASFLTATITDWEKLNLLSGEANVYFEEKFIGKTFINGANVKNELKISLGRDARIIAERKEIDNIKTRKTFGSNIKESFGYRTTLRNTKSEAVTVVVEDQIPISKDSDIEVDIEEISGAVIDKETGKLTWEVIIEPAQTKEILIKYTVKYPKDKRVNNL
jgi:uncharacterized protein (TIGR02231 family)